VISSATILSSIVETVMVPCEIEFNCQIWWGRSLHNSRSNANNCRPFHRKPLNLLAESVGDWDLRFEPDNHFRVFYAVERKHFRVLILAVGIKQRDRLTILGHRVGPNYSVGIQGLSFQK